VYGCCSAESTLALPKFCISVVVDRLVLMLRPGARDGKAAEDNVAVISSSAEDEETELGGEVMNPSSDSGLPTRGMASPPSSTAMIISSGLLGNESLLLESSLDIDSELSGLARSCPVNERPRCKSDVGRTTGLWPK